MEPEGSLPYLQQSATGTYPEPDASPIQNFPIYWRRIHFNIILLQILV
jgi:hypothetical protein